MDEKKLRKRVDLLAYALAATFLAIHIAMLVVFAVCGVSPMVYVNIFSIAFYLAMMFLIRKGLLTQFAIATFFEINVHMALAIVFTGWGAGFQITIIGIVILLFFCEYIARSLGIKFIPSVFLTPISALVYIGTFVVTLFLDTPYPLPDWANIGMQIAWAIIVFGIMSMILYVFVNTTTRSQSELSNEAVHDRLTGLPNRYFMSTCFQKVEEMGADYHGWIAIADIDDFKSINDTYGHNCGDYVLKSLASLLGEVDKNIVVCRWGGEEFLLMGDDGASAPEVVLEDFRKAVESYPFSFDGVSLHLTITIGYAWKEGGQTLGEWIDEADKRLYLGKNSGKNRLV